jgi:hypothetical protein
MARMIGPLAYAWLIIIGALMFTPDGVQCIACGPMGTRIVGVISILLGVVGFIAGRRAPSAGG